MATGSVNNNPYLQQVLFQNLSSSSIQPSQLKSSAELISSAYTAKSGVATISANGNKINNISSAIRASGDTKASEGFQASVSGAVSSSNPLNLVRFVTSADYAVKKDLQGTNEAFAALAGNLGGDDSALVNSFNSAFTSTIEKAGTEGLVNFNKASKAVEGADYSGSTVTQSQNFQKMMTTISQSNSLSQNDQEAISNLDRLAQGVEIQDSADSIWNFFNDFIGAGPENNV